MARRHSRHIHNEGSDRWLVSYADFVTLLFAFFTVMYATSQLDAEKGKSFEESVKKYLMKVGMGTESQEKLDTEEKKANPIESPIKQYDSNNSKLGRLQSRIETYLEENLSEEQLKKLLQDVSGDEMGVRVSFRASAFFVDKSAQLDVGSGKSLIKIGKWFKNENIKFFIESHSKENNSWDLTSRRAALLAKYFIEVQGIDPSRVGAVSYANTRPIAAGAQSGENDRIEFLIFASDMPF